MAAADSASEGGADGELSSRVCDDPGDSLLSVCLAELACNGPVGVLYGEGLEGASDCLVPVKLPANFRLTDPFGAGTERECSQIQWCSLP